MYSNLLCSSFIRIKAADLRLLLLNKISNNICVSCYEKKSKLIFDLIINQNRFFFSDNLNINFEIQNTGITLIAYEISWLH